MVQLVTVGGILEVQRGGGSGAITPILDFNFLTQQVSNSAIVPTGLTALVRAATNAPRYAWGSNGYLSAALGANVPCYEWDSDGNPEGLRLEPSMTNLCIHSTSLRSDLGNWSNGFTTNNTSVADDPSGGTAGASITDQSLRQTVTAGANTYVMSVFFKSPGLVDGTGVQFGIVDNSFNLLEQVSFVAGGEFYCARLVNGAPVPLVSPGILSAGLKKVGTHGWWQGWAVCITGNAINTNGYIVITNKVSSSALVSGATSVHHASLCVGTIPPNPIDTTTVAMPNDGEVLSLDAGSLATWQALGDNWTTVADIDLPDTGRVLTTGGASLMDALTTGSTNRLPYSAPYPRRIVLANNASGSKMWDSYAPASPVTGAKQTIGADVTLGLDKPLHFRRLRVYNKGLT